MGTSSKVVATVTALVAPVIEEMGMELVDVEFVREQGSWFLRIYIDKPGGVGIDDCQAVSERVDVLLDQVDPIPHSYHLEVSSPGIERPLKKPAHFEKVIGKTIQVSTFAPVEGRRRFKGVLTAVNAEGINLNVDGRSYTIPFPQIARANLVVDLAEILGRTQ